MAKKVYAVKKGITTGIFNTWDECKRQVHGFPGAQYKSFPTLKEAQEYLTGGQTGDAAPDENDPDVCVAYVDGSFDASRGAYSYGCILLHGNERKEMSQAFVGTEDVSMRNVAGELEALWLPWLIVRLMKSITCICIMIIRGLNPGQPENGNVTNRAPSGTRNSMTIFKRSRCIFTR